MEALKAILEAEYIALSHINPDGELFFYIQRDAVIMGAILQRLYTKPLIMRGKPRRKRIYASNTICRFRRSFTLVSATCLKAL